MRHQLKWFIAFTVMLGMVFAWKTWKLMPLYTDGALRQKASVAMQAVAEREGWLLSDMIATEITDDRIRLNHREHKRGTDNETCVMILLKDNSFAKCE